VKTLFVCLFLITSVSYAQFAVGDNVSVSNPQGCANVRSALTTTVPPLKCEPNGTTGVVRSAPTTWGTSAYYTVAFADGVTGWIAGLWLQRASGPVVDPPVGSLSVTPIAGGIATLSFSAKNDTVGVLQIVQGEYRGALSIQLSTPAMFIYTLSGPGGERTYTASTLDGVPLPPPVELDSTRIAEAAYNLGRNSGLLEGIVTGKASVTVDSVKVKLSNGREVTR
jgi:hypothetical protein